MDISNPLLPTSNRHMDKFMDIWRFPFRHGGTHFSSSTYRLGFSINQPANGIPHYFPWDGDTPTTFSKMFHEINQPAVETG